MADPLQYILRQQQQDEEAGLGLLFKVLGMREARQAKQEDIELALAKQEMEGGHYKALEDIEREKLGVARETKSADTAAEALKNKLAVALKLSENPNVPQNVWMGQLEGLDETLAAPIRAQREATLGTQARELERMVGGLYGKPKLLQQQLENLTPEQIDRIRWWKINQEYEPEKPWFPAQPLAPSEAEVPTATQMSSSPSLFDLLRVASGTGVNEAGMQPWQRPAVPTKPPVNPALPWR